MRRIVPQIPRRKSRPPAPHVHATVTATALRYVLQNTRIAAKDDPAMDVTPLRTPPHRRRWLLVGGIVGVLLVAYALALAWAAQRLESDMQHSIRQLPTVQQDRGG
jgi:ferric-dicitrate binding protein FerR (iron transport regulator)